LGVSLRTLQRDIVDINEAGFPLTPPINGKYSFVEGYSLKTAEATEEEAAILAFISGITKNLGKDFANPFNIIKQKLMCPRLDSPFYIKMPKTPGYVETDIIKQIKNAVENNQIIEIKYPNSKGRQCGHTVHPYKIVNYDGFWYLYALKNGEKRTYKLDRITKCTPSEKTFKPRQTVLKDLESSGNIWFGLKPKTKVKLLINASAAGFFKTKAYFPRQKILKTHQNGDLELECTINHPREVMHTVLSWMPNIKIISPKQITDILIKKVKKYLE